jgi:hypothetical protein
MFERNIPWQSFIQVGICSCEILSPCGSNPCVRGTCRNQNSTSYQCICEPGFTGKSDQFSWILYSFFPFQVRHARRPMMFAAQIHVRRAVERLPTRRSRVTLGQHGGTCRNLGSGSRSCLCPPTYTGNRIV